MVNNKINDLKKELVKLEKEQNEKKEIRDLQKKIKQRKFNNSKTGKVFNKIADVGDKLTKKQAKNTNSVKKQVKRLTIAEIMAKLPQ
jgi:hypothetical protein